MGRCDWGDTTEKMIHYHDTEWGFPVHDDRMEFEYLVLEAMQCGLSWNLIIEKREIMRACFENFDFLKMSSYTKEDVERIMACPGMIRSPRKIEAMIHNAKCYLKIIEEFGSFDTYLWSYTDGKTICYKGHEKGHMPAKNALSERISKDLKKRGFKYMGPVVVYSYMQACGLINDHTACCDQYKYINEHFPVVTKECDGEA